MGGIDTAEYEMYKLEFSTWDPEVFIEIDSEIWGNGLPNLVTLSRNCKCILEEEGCSSCLGLSEGW